MFTFQFEAQPEDVARFHIFAAEDQPDNKMRAVIRRSLIFLCYAVFATILFVKGRYATAMAIMLFAVAFFLLIKPLNRLIIRSRVRALWKRNPGMNRTVKIQFDADSAMLEKPGGGSTLTFRYTELADVYEKNGYLFLMVNRNYGVYLPFRAFRDEEEYSIFKQFLTLKTGKPIQ